MEILADGPTTVFLEILLPDLLRLGFRKITDLTAHSDGESSV